MLQLHIKVPYITTRHKKLINNVSSSELLKYKTILFYKTCKAP